MNAEDTNLEVKIARLDTKLDFAIAEIKDLKENLAGRIDRLENTKFASNDFVQFRNNEFVPLKSDVEALMRYRWILAGIISFSMFLAPYIWQVINKKIEQ